MSNITKTYSGDFSSFIAGKLLNAAGMAKGEKERRETENLEKARPGSLFVKALQSEFGGDLYNRTLGNFDPRKSAGETDRKSSREKRYQAQFGELKKTPKSDLDDAEKELLKDDDSIPVKDVGSRENISKILGVGLHTKVLLADARVTGLSNDVGAINDNLVNTQKLIYDQNEMIGSKFDQILEIYSGQKDYQKKIADKAEVQRRETELEAEKDLSATRKLQSTVATKKGPDILGSILGVAADMLRGKKGGKIFSSLLNALKNTKSKTDKVRALANVARLLIGARRDTVRGRAAFNFGKGVYDRLRTDTLEEAIGLSKPRTRTEKLKEIATNKPARSPINLDVKGPVRNWDASSMMMQSTTLATISPMDKEILSAVLDTDVENLPSVLSKPGVSEKLKQAAADGIIDSSDIPRLQKNADALVKSVKPPSPATSRRMASEVTEKLGTTGGAQLLESAGKKGSSKLLGKAGKFVPGLGTGVSLAEAGYRFSQGDITGGILSLGSAIPILGWGFTAIDIARDLGYNPMGLPEAPQYERGTDLTKPGMGVLHGTELRVTSKDREDMLGSYKDAIDQIGSTLVSSAVSLGDVSGFGQEVKSELKKSGLQYDIVNIPLSTNIGKGSLSQSLVSDLTPDIPGVSGKRTSDSNDEETEETNPNENPPPNPNPSPNPLPVESDPLTTPSGVIIDETKEPGGDFTPAGSNNRVIYEGEVVEIGHQYNPNGEGGDGRKGAGYGTYVVVRSSHPEYGEFDGLYAHFPGKDSIVVKPGQKVKRGDILGPMATAAQFADPNTRPIVGSGTGPHTSLDFLKVNSNAKHPYWRQLTNGIDPNFKTEPSEGEGGSGERATAFHELSKDEALSSLTPGVNDYVKPGGRSVISNTPWESITDDTLLHVYADSEGVPTIGYGSAAMRGINFGTRPITVRQARAWLKDDISRISSNLSKNIKWWNSMTSNQRAGLIMFEYNAGEGNSYISSKGYPSLVRQLEAGNIRAAIPEIQREGPGQSRINLEQDLLRSGPQQIVGPKIVGPKIVGEGKVGSGIPFFPDLTIMKGIQDGLQRSNEREKNSELLKLLPMLDNKPDNLRSSSQLMEDMEEQVIQQVYVVNNVVASSPPPPIITSSGRSSTDYVDQYRMAVLGA